MSRTHDEWVVGKYIAYIKKPAALAMMIHQDYFEEMINNRKSMQGLWSNTQPIEFVGNKRCFTSARPSLLA